MIVSSPETTPEECSGRAGSHAGTGWNRRFRFDVGNRTATIAALATYRIWNTPARLVSDGISRFKRTGRTLPPPGEIRRPLHAGKTSGSRGRIRRQDRAAGAAAVEGDAEFAGRGDVNRSSPTSLAATCPGRTPARSYRASA